MLFVGFTKRKLVLDNQNELSWVAKKVEHVFVHLYIKHNYIINVANGQAIRLKNGVVKPIWGILKMIPFCYTDILDKFSVLKVESQPLLIVLLF